MPLYEYKCTQCQSTIEVLQKATDKPLEKCESCGGPLAKLLSSPAIQFKGSGWYITDYARKNVPVKTEATESKAGTDDKTSKKDSKNPSSTAK